MSQKNTTKWHSSAIKRQKVSRVKNKSLVLTFFFQKYIFVGSITQNVVYTCFLSGIPVHTEGFFLKQLPIARHWEVLLLRVAAMTSTNMRFCRFCLLQHYSSTNSQFLNEVILKKGYGETHISLLTPSFDCINDLNSREANESYRVWHPNCTPSTT